MSDQVDTKQVTWQDLEVAEEEQNVSAELSVGIRMLRNISHEELAKQFEQLGMRYRRFERLAFLHGSQALCTPSRTSLTGKEEVPDDER